MSQYNFLYILETSKDFLKKVVKVDNKSQSFQFESAWLLRHFSTTLEVKIVKKKKKCTIFFQEKVLLYRVIQKNYRLIIEKKEKHPLAKKLYLTSQPECDSAV